MEHGVHVQGHVGEGQGQGDDVFPEDHRQEGKTAKVMEKRLNFVKPSLVQKVRLADYPACLLLLFIPRQGCRRRYLR